LRSRETPVLLNGSEEDAHDYDERSEECLGESAEMLTPHKEVI
jgi:hypothetical protein